MRNKPRLVAPFYDKYVYIWFYLVLRTVTHYCSGPRNADGTGSTNRRLQPPLRPMQPRILSSYKIHGLRLPPFEFRGGRLLPVIDNIYLRQKSIIRRGSLLNNACNELYGFIVGGKPLRLALKIVSIRTRYNQISWSTTFVDHDISVQYFPRLADAPCGGSDAGAGVLRSTNCDLWKLPSRDGNLGGRWITYSYGISGDAI